MSSNKLSDAKKNWSRPLWFRLFTLRRVTSKCRNLKGFDLRVIRRLTTLQVPVVCQNPSRTFVFFGDFDLQSSFHLNVKPGRTSGAHPPGLICSLSERFTPSTFSRTARRNHKGFQLLFSRKQISKTTRPHGNRTGTINSVGA